MAESRSRLLCRGAMQTFVRILLATLATTRTQLVAWQCMPGEPHRYWVVGTMIKQPSVVERLQNPRGYS